VIWLAQLPVILVKPHSDFLIASDVTYSKTVVRGSNVEYRGRRPSGRSLLARGYPEEY
jgi:hypothetical protein